MSASLDLTILKLTTTQEKATLAKALRENKGFEDAPLSLKEDLVSVLEKNIPIPNLHVLVALLKTTEKKNLAASDILGVATFQVSKVPEREETKATTSPAVEVIDVFVHNEYRRRGVAKCLVCALEDAARHRLCDRGKTSLFCDEIEKLAPLSPSVNSMGAVDRDLLLLESRCKTGAFMSQGRDIVTMVCKGGDM